MTTYRQRSLTAPRSSFYLFGPRGTGKTTWVRHEYRDAYRIDLLDEALYQSYLADIGRFAGELQAAAPNAWVFVDEIERLPGLLNEVQRHIEAKASVRVHDRHLAGLRAVAPLPGLQRRILTYTGSRRMRTPYGIDIWPLPDLLEALHSDRIW